MAITLELWLVTQLWAQSWGRNKIRNNVNGTIERVRDNRILIGWVVAVMGRILFVFLKTTMFSTRGQGEELVRILYRKNWDRILYHRIIQFRYFHCFYPFSQVVKWESCMYLEEWRTCMNTYMPYRGCQGSTCEKQ